MIVIPIATLFVVVSESFLYYSFLSFTTASDIFFSFLLQIVVILLYLETFPAFAPGTVKSGFNVEAEEDKHTVNV